MRQKCLLLVALIGGFGLVLVPTHAVSQSCVTFEADHSSASFMLLSSPLLKGLSPASFCELVPGQRYSLRVQSRGYETRSLNFKLREDGSVDVSGNRLAHVSRSLIIPGWGQWKLGEYERGGWAVGLGVGSLTYLGFVAYDYKQVSDEYDDLEALLKDADNQDDIERLAELTLAKSKEANTQRQYLIEVGAFAGYVHLTQLVESWLLSTSPSTSIDGRTVMVTTPRKSNTRAVIRSMFFPGLGQEYVGSHFKGYLYQSAFLITGIGVIESRKDTRQAGDEYDLARWDVENANGVDEIQSAQNRSQAAWNELQEKEDRRNAWYIAAGSVWLLNVIDAAFSGKLSNEDAGFFEASLVGKTVHTGINVRF